VSPLTLAHDRDRFWGGFTAQTFTLPAVCHPAVRAAASKILEVQARRDELHGKAGSRPQARSKLMRSLAREPDRAEKLQAFDADTEFLVTVDVPEAEQALRDAWQRFSAVFWQSRGETREYVIRELHPVLTADPVEQHLHRRGEELPSEHPTVSVKICSGTP
jgi:hypothetical protein